MGYTLYWYREKTVDQAVFQRMLDDFKKILPEIDRSEVVLAGPDGEGLPMINEYGVSFNGKCESQGCCESFNFVQDLIFVYHQPRKRNGKYFQYAKTGGLPYGLAAAAFLIIAKQYLRDQITVSSDAPLPDWDKPRRWCQRILGFGSEFLPESDFEE